jgi:hypothetical protein
MALHRRLCVTPDTMKGEQRESRSGAVQGVLHLNSAAPSGQPLVGLP